MKAKLIVTFVLTVMQAYFVGASSENNGLSNVSGFSFRIFIILILTASIGFLLVVALPSSGDYFDYLHRTRSKKYPLGLLHFMDIVNTGEGTF